MTPPLPPRRGLRGTPHPVAVLGWLALATAVVLGRRAAPPAQPPERPLLLAPPGDSAPAPVAFPPVPVDTIARHEPVVVMSDWLHAPVEVLASPADSASAAKPDWRARLPKPVAALRSFASPLIMPRLTLPRALTPDFSALRALVARAQPNEPVNVTLTAYCLHGTTRQGTPTRTGIVAADPHVFPMMRHVHLFSAGRYLGRFRVEDTGGAVHGAHIDIWTPDCADAGRFGTRPGVASLVAFGD